MKAGMAKTYCLLISLIVICPLCQQQLAEKRDVLLADTSMGYYIPSSVTGPVSLDFKGVVSDFLYLKISTFLGGKIVAKEMMDDSHAELIYQAADIITDLDPWFWDAYLMGEMILAWDFKRVDLANKLLLKATKYRTWDFYPFYYLGFNYFYFLKDNNKGAKYLMEASRFPGSPSYLPVLATRLSIYQNKFEPAIIFLEELLSTTQNPVLKNQLETRLKTLIILSHLEKKVKEFKQKQGAFPKKITELISSGFIDHIPEDPYGGEFFILKNGRVFTTSEMRFSKKKENLIK